MVIAILATLHAHAGELPVTFTEESKLRYWMVDDRLPSHPDRAVLNYVEQVNRLSARGSFGDWGVWLQLDEVALFANQYYLDDVLIAERELMEPGNDSPLPGFSWVNPEKVAVTYETRAVSVDLGDFYASFGRGLALNVTRRVDLDIDTSIQGAKVTARPGAWELTGLIGQLNRQQVFLANPNGAFDGNRGVEGDRRHAVAGFRAERFGLGPANVGVHGVVYDFVSETGLRAGFSEIGTTPDAVVGGATVELMSVGGVDWFVEADGFAYPTDTLFGGASAEPGYGLYGSAAFYPGLTTWLVEVKQYVNAERLNATLGREQYEVAIGPTLEYERATTEDSAAALNSNDVTGGSVRVDLSAADGVIPYVQVGVFRDREVGGLHFNDVPETIVHPVAGLELTRGHTAVLFNAGYRVDDRDGSDAGSDRQLHGDLDLKFPLGHGWLGNVQSGLERFQWGVNAFQQTDYLETENAFVIQKGSDLAFIAYLDHTTNPLVDSTGNLADDVYGAVEVQVKPTSDMTIKAFYGAYKAGIRCSGGQCRLLPGFEGTRVTFTGTF